MNEILYNKIVNYDLEALFKKKHYAFFTNGIYNVNIIGVRSNQNNKVTNKFDDALILDYNTKVGHKRHVYTITTDPGLYYMKNPINKKGTGILIPGQYRGAYCVAIHNGKYKALCQRLKPVKVYRDNNKNDIYDLYPETIDCGMFGANIHRASNTKKSITVDKWSAACQVFADPKEFDSFMTIIEKSRAIYGNSFTYTLITEKDLK